MDAATAFVMREIDLIRTCLLPPQKWHSNACNSDSIELYYYDLVAQFSMSKKEKKP
jgi:hypothetical protein